MTSYLPILKLRGIWRFSPLCDILNVKGSNQYREIIRGAIIIFTKVFYLGEITLDKLVPFKNYPIEKLGGRLLRDAKDELRSAKPYEPISVRRLEPDLNIKDNDLYEILDGHYKVAAAKELGWSTIRAKSLGWLSEGEALSHIPDWEPVGLLYKYGLDIL